MKLSCAFGASLLLLTAVPAAATSYPGEEVTVNPGAIGSGYLLGIPTPVYLMGVCLAAGSAFVIRTIGRRE